MTDVLEFHDIAQEIKGAMNGGRLKLSKQGLFFKNNKTGKVDQIHADDVDKTNWLKVARGYELKLYTNNGSIYKYDGFKETDQERIGTFIKNNFNWELEEKEVSLKGWNWGTATFKGSELAFAVDKKPAFHLPLGNVSHTTTAKNEVILEFHQNDDADISLMEMRFYVPPTEADANPVEEFHEKILAKADIIQATGDALCSLEQIPCLTPRGRYDVKIFPTFLQLHGKTFDYKIPYTTVLRLFLLPHKDNRQMYFVLSLDPPIVQGQTRYHFLILSFNKEDELTVELNVTEEDLTEKYQGKLQKEMTGASFEIISRLMKSLTGRKITIPGSFQTLGGAKSMSCSYKSNSGFLYPLERGFMYVHKPPIHIRFDEIACVNFSRGTGSTTRYFDFEIEVKNGTVFVFSSIDKNEYGPLFDFVSGKKLRVKNRGMKGEGINYDELLDSDNEDGHDAYLEQMKREGRERDVEDEDYMVNDDSDESDEDFDPDVGEASDVELEYDSNASESSSSDGDWTAGSGHGSEVEDGEIRERRHKEKKEKRKKEKKKKVRTVSERPRKRKAKKEKEDPNKPKRNPSAYMMWLNENREEIKEKAGANSGVTDVAKKAGEIWGKLSTDEKTTWQDKASEAKREYQKAMMEYNKRKEEEKEEGGGSEGEEEEEGEGTPAKKKSKKSKKKTSPSPKKTTAGSGTNYKSKEYISSESSSDEDKESKKSEASEKEESEKEESEKEESEKEESEKEELEKEESEKEASEAENEEASDAGSD